MSDQRVRSLSDFGRAPKRIRELYATDGIDGVVRGVRDFLPLSRGTDYAATRVDNESRWEFIEPYITDAETLMDIGCAEGYFTRRAADSGLWAMGIEADVSRVARAGEYNTTNVAWVTHTVTPTSLQHLPDMDVILLLTVHHHWEQQYGLNTAEQMFITLLEKCDRLIYEPPGDRPLVKSAAQTLDPANSLDFYRDRLEALHGERLDILDEMIADYRDGLSWRADPVFVLESKIH